MLSIDDATIAAIATPYGSGGVGIVRVSGSLSLAIANAIIKPNKKIFPRHAHVSSFFDQQGEVIDHGIIIYFPAPNSFTGEDIVELHGHGGMVVLNHLLELVLHYGARSAEPGEFSLRAFLNHKIDLAQAEAIADLIGAQSRQAAQSAIRSLQGNFSKKIYALVEKLISIRIQVEAHIDFPEEDIDLITQTHLINELTNVITQLENIQKIAYQGKLLRDGLQVVIVGKPNAGKSTLLNQLCGEEIAIVSDYAGTTRDVIREQLNFEGIPLTIIDTAGIHETENPIEQEGIRRTQKEMNHADIILLLHDSCENFESIKDYFATVLKDVMIDKQIIIHNKIDLIPNYVNTAYSYWHDAKEHVFVSAKTGENIDILKKAIQKKIGMESFQEGIFSARLRHIQAVIEAKNFISMALEKLCQGEFYEFVAEELRLATKELNKITGEFSADDLLGEIFKSFCIGK